MGADARRSLPRGGAEVVALCGQHEAPTREVKAAAREMAVARKGAALRASLSLLTAGVTALGAFIVVQKAVRGGLRRALPGPDHRAGHA